MAIYRALKDLSNGINRGEIFPSTRLKATSLPILEDRRAIAQVSLPPLSALPGWTRRAAKLAPHGIEDAGQFLEASGEILAKTLKVQPATVEAWKGEIIRWLSDPSPKKG